MPFDQIVDGSDIPHIGKANCNLILDIVNISEIPTIFRNQTVYHRDGVPMLNQPAGKVGANKA